MKTGTKIFLDRHVTGLLARMLNLVVIPLGRLLRIDHSLTHSFRTIAVCKYKGMGSILQATPLLRTLRSRYPDSHIVFVTSAENIPILALIPEVDEVVFIDDRSLLSLLRTFLPFLRKLIGLRIEVYLDLEVYSNFSTLVSVLSMARNRMGFYLNSKHYRLGNYTHMMYYNTRSAISETYLQFARMLGCHEIETELSPLQSGTDSLNLDGRSLNLDKTPYLVINPNASDLRIERRWPASGYAGLIGWLAAEYPEMYIFLVGARSEKEYVEEVLRLSRSGSEKVVSLAGKTGIPELVALIRHADVFITNDSGPMHIAFATRTPTVALFGPCSPSQYGVNPACYPVYANLYCSPCVHEFVQPPCGGDNICMKIIPAEKVKQYIRHILSGSSLPAAEEGGILFRVGHTTVGRLDRNRNGENV